MVLADVVGVLTRPRRRLRAIAEEGRSTAEAMAVVIGTGMVLLTVGVGAALVEPARTGAGVDARTLEVAVSLALPLLLAGFWLAGGWLTDGAATLMTGVRRLRASLVATAYALPVLVSFELLRLVQAVLDRAGGSGADTAAVLVGLAGLVTLLWFVALLAIAVGAVHELNAMSALAAAMLPFAAMAALLIVLLVVASLLHAVGVG